MGLSGPLHAAECIKRDAGVGMAVESWAAKLWVGRRRFLLSATPESESSVFWPGHSATAETIPAALRETSFVKSGEAVRRRR